VQSTHTNVYCSIRLATSEIPSLRLSTTPHSAPASESLLPPNHTQHSSPSLLFPQRSFPPRLRLPPSPSSAFLSLLSPVLSSTSSPSFSFLRSCPRLSCTNCSWSVTHSLPSYVSYNPPSLPPKPLNSSCRRVRTRQTRSSTGQVEVEVEQPERVRRSTSGSVKVTERKRAAPSCNSCNHHSETPLPSPRLIIR